MAVPHAFPSLLDTHAGPSVLLIGAGLSADIAPSVAELAQNVASSYAAVLAILQVNPGPPPNANDFYDWADRAFQLLQHQGLTASAAKLRLAEATGVTTNPKFRQHVKTLLRTEWPRHRVIARLAREGRWRAIWSLNWDCVLETALECVGLRVHPDPNVASPNPLPWHSWFCTWSPGDAYGIANHPGTIWVVKPHGCVSKLRTGNPLFIVTRTELNNLTPQLQHAAGQMTAGFSNCPVVTMGWKAEEDYIYANMQAIAQSGLLLATGIDRLSIVNRTWYPVPPSTAAQNHNRVAHLFSRTQNECFFPAGSSGAPTMDELAFWIQTRYALTMLRSFAAAHADCVQFVSDLDAILHHFAEPRANHPLNRFFDEFLPVWTRFCFNAGKVTFWQHGAAVPQTMVATQLRDEHIPWGYGHVPRLDLLAVIPLVVTIWQKAGAASSTQWDFNQFPGGLWDNGNGNLVIPLPAWDDLMRPIEIAAIKPLMEDRSWPTKGAVRQLSILPLPALPTQANFADPNMVMRTSVAAEFKSGQFAMPGNIGLAALGHL